MPYFYYFYHSASVNCDTSQHQLVARSRGCFTTYSPGDFELPNSEVSISSSAEWVTEPTLESLYGFLEGTGSEMMYLPRLALLFQA